jgi:hypothetical protein
MGLDIRRPIGLLFTILGAILVIYGLVADPAVYRKSLGYNVDLLWGACVLAFGVTCLALAARGRPTSREAEASPQGRAIEAREHELGLEREGTGTAP